MVLALPPENFSQLHLDIVSLRPTALSRVTRYPDTEPFFGKTKNHRFDDPLQGFGICYAGENFMTAFAETLLHDLLPVDGKYHLSVTTLESRYVVTFDGEELNVANFTGVSLKRLGGTNAISSEVPYSTPQLWSRAAHDHPKGVDGIQYVSRHVNTEFSYAVFDRARMKFRRASVVPLTDHPDLAQALDVFAVELA